MLVILPYALIISILLALLTLINAHFFNVSAKKEILNSQRVFTTLGINDTEKLKAALELILANRDFLEPLAERDRDALFARLNPIFENLLQRYRITHMYFHNMPPDNTVFQRIHNRNLHGDELERITYKRSVERKQFASGIELGKTAFALRTVHPCFFEGPLIGYVELGEEIDHFPQLMKNQTGNEYGILVFKRYLSEEDWASVRDVKGLRNNWDDHRGVVLINQTNPIIEGMMDFDLNIGEISSEGKLLGRGDRGRRLCPR